MSNENRFEEVGGGSEGLRWEPNKPENMANPKYPKELLGYLKNVKEINGPNGVFEVAIIHAMDKTDPKKLGVEVNVSLGKVFAEKINEITLGSFVKIAFLGKTPSKTPGRQPYNNVKVFVDPGAVKYSELGGVDKAKVAVQNNSVQNTTTTASVQNTSNVTGGPAVGNVFEDDLPF